MFLVKNEHLSVFVSHQYIKKEKKQSLVLLIINCPETLWVLLKAVGFSCL